MLERGERIELLVDKTDTLNQHASGFKKRSTQVKVSRMGGWMNIGMVKELTPTDCHNSVPCGGRT